jgi:hypothetical protein
MEVENHMLQGKWTRTDGDGFGLESLNKGPRVKVCTFLSWYCCLLTMTQRKCESGEGPRVNAEMHGLWTDLLHT